MTNDRNKEKGGGGGGGGAASKTAIGSDLGIEFSRADYDMINEIHSFESQGCNSIDNSNFGPKLGHVLGQLHY